VTPTEIKRIPAIAKIANLKGNSTKIPLKKQKR